MPYVFQFGPILDRWPLFLWGTVLTVQLAVVSSAIGLVLALLLGVARSIGPRWAGRLVGAYVELIRNTPLLVQLYLVYFVLPRTGVRLDSIQAATLALALNFAAYAAEIVRAGLDATPRGLVEAGLSLGLSSTRILRHVVLLPALRAVYPALGSQFVLQLLGSSLASAIAAEELSAVSNNIMMETFRNFEVFVVSGAIYLALVLVFRGFFMATDRTLFRWAG